MSGRPYILSTIGRSDASERPFVAVSAYSATFLASAWMRWAMWAGTGS